MAPSFVNTTVDEFVIVGDAVNKTECHILLCSPKIIIILIITVVISNHSR